MKPDQWPFLSDSLPNKWSSMRAAFPAALLTASSMRAPSAWTATGWCPVGPRFQRHALVGRAAFVRIHVRHVDLDMGQPLLEPRQLLPHPLLQPLIRLGVGKNLIVGVDLHEHE
jgi:hypothetical protein